MLRGEESKESLTAEDIDRCDKMVDNFLRTTDPSETIMLSDRLMINQCFYHFKHIYKDVEKRGGSGEGAMQPSSPAPAGNNMDSSEFQEEVQRLKILVQQRDNEIAIL